MNGDVSIVSMASLSKQRFTFVAWLQTADCTFGQYAIMRMRSNVFTSDDQSFALLPVPAMLGFSLHTGWHICRIRESPERCL